MIMISAPIIPIGGRASISKQPSCTHKLPAGGLSNRYSLGQFACLFFPLFPVPLIGAIFDWKAHELPGDEQGSEEFA